MRSSKDLAPSSDELFLAGLSETSAVGIKGFESCQNRKAKGRHLPFDFRRALRSLSALLHQSLQPSGLAPRAGATQQISMCLINGLRLELNENDRCCAGHRRRRTNFAPEAASVSCSS
jgi:hypothetical protein